MVLLSMNHLTAHADQLLNSDSQNLLSLNPGILIFKKFLSTMLPRRISSIHRLWVCILEAYSNETFLPIQHWTGHSERFRAGDHAESRISCNIMTLKVQTNVHKTMFMKTTCFTIFCCALGQKATRIQVKIRELSFQPKEPNTNSCAQPVLLPGIYWNRQSRAQSGSELPRIGSMLKYLRSLYFHSQSVGNFGVCGTVIPSPDFHWFKSS